MKTSSLFAACFVLLAAASLFAGPRDAEWKAVDEAMGKGLPKTAIEKLEPIITGAMKDKAYAEATKAIAKKIAFEGNIQGNKPEEKITRMRAEIEKAPDEMKPVMEAILANWFWHYFQQNRWRFLQRTQTAQQPGDDFTSWDLARIMAEIDKQFTKALANEKVLKGVKIGQYDDLLQKGNVPDNYRPTLYDFLAFNALEFYVAGEQAGAKAEDAFVLTADSPIFGTAEEFVKWQPETTDGESITLKAIKLYQDLLKFHADDQDKTAWLDADFLRLSFGNNKAVGEEKPARFKAALKRFTDKYGDHEVSARALHAWAQQLFGEGERVEARKLAQRGANAFPNSVGGKLCYNLVLTIDQKHSQISVERVWNEPWPKINVYYKNVTKIYLRAVADDYEARLKSARWRPEHLDQNEYNAILGKKPAAEWSADLPATEDFHERNEQVDVPQDLKPGFYFILSSHKPDFSEADNSLGLAACWVSKLALVVRNRQADGVLEGFVLNANSGEPIAGADVQAWYQDQNGKRAPTEAVKTNENGLFTAKIVNQRSHLVVAKHMGDMVSSASDHWLHTHDSRPKPYTTTVFFADRSLYRPGQTVQYKGICIRVDQEGNKYETIAGQTLTVLFVDPNGKEITRQQHKANDYGSFNGSFTAPSDRLMGNMFIRVEGEPHGQTHIGVEEYKRPKFQTTLDAPKTAAKLNALVQLEGKATAYTGAAIDGAKVRWRVVRQVRYPIWWGWCYWWRVPRTDAQEIAHGTGQTDAAGKFKIEFTAKPDPTVLEKDEPTFHYQITADVTDTTGETRSASREITVGYTALKAAMTAEEWQEAEKPVEITINTTTLDGEPQAAEGTIKIHALKQPKTVVRPSLGGRPVPMPRRGDLGKTVEPKPDPANIHSWPLGDVVFEAKWKTDATGKTTVSAKLPVGPFKALLETKDRFGKPVTAQLPIRVLDPAAKKFPIRLFADVAAPKWTLEPGADFTAVWGSGYDVARAFVEIEQRKKIVQSYWTPKDQTQVAIKQAISEALRGGFTLRVTMVRENRAFLFTRKVEVPWTNKNLTVKWEHFTSKLQPAQKETWTATVSGPDAKKAVAEVVAGLYDESLDAYRPHNWMQRFGVFYTDHVQMWPQFENSLVSFQHFRGNWHQQHKDTTWTYRHFPHDIIGNFWGYQFFGRGNRFAAPGAPMAAEAAKGGRELQSDRQSLRKADGDEQLAQNGARARRSLDAVEKQAAGQAGAPGEDAGPDLSQVSARKNLQETAFFFPHLVSSADGEVKIEFTMPEALTKWKFQAFAHDKELRSGSLTDHTVTAKDLMVQPNPPRFVREGDVLEFTVKVSNQSPTRQTGKVRLTFNDARTLASMDAALGVTGDQAFDIPSMESKSFSWKLTVPDDAGFLTYKTVGSTGRISDGEEGYLPVLSRRILVTESLPLPLRGAQTKKFDFTRLSQSGKSNTLKSKTLSVQMVSNPSWYAVMALPYLMEAQHECSETVFNRLYANGLARHIAASDPKIRRVFDQWKGTPALDSPLEKNQDLKAVMLQETPWLKQAQSESQARRNVGILFDDNRLNDETARNLRKLTDMQLGDGAWPWFPGGPANDYLTLYITTGFGRMRHLGVKVDMAPAVKSLGRLDNWIDQIYRECLKHKPEENHLTSTIALYLYGRSFFLTDKPIAPQHKEAVDYFLGQAKKYWLKLAIRQSQGHLAIALKRFGDVETAKGIMASIKERSVSNEELGMFWRELEFSWFWFRAPIETQALMIEAFDEVMNDAEAVEDCKVWLLKQKQTQDWKTTKATADAVYALLLRGSNLLASDSLVELTLGNQPIKPEKVEAGTGFYETRFFGGDIKPALGQITAKKTDPGVSWGSVHWQYLEDMTKVTPYEGTPLKLKKTLFTKQHSKKGPVLTPITGPLSVGDELVTRVEIRVDRDMEYVHLKDQRGSGTEPVNVLSVYKYQDGLAYYESTRDTASHFYIDYLPKGTYVFEYTVRIQHRGSYQSGMAEIQCLYAPEFNSHSESFGLEVK